jgi:RHS repeat-associated protein
VDINGDGLSDRVYANGNVELNLGYSFLPQEQWGYKGLSDGEAYTYGGGISINISNYSIAAGSSFSRTENQRKNSLQDMNGDGLPDYIAGVSPLKVRINSGTGFGPEITWSGADAVSRGMSTGETINVGFTIGITLIPILPIGKLCINPQITISQGADRTKVDFNDIDGDGYPDYLVSDIDNKLTVSRSTIKRTNRLKKVSRPLGGSFVLDYKRVGNTYDMPNSIWALSSVDLYDGVPGDGPEKRNNTFEYQNGRYNRNEREFYGFGKLIVKNNNTNNNNVVYRSMEEEYLNDNFYNKGLLKSEVLKDANGNKFTETKNTYELKNITTGATLSDALAKTDNGTAFPALIATEKFFYEGQSMAGKSTRTTFLYDVLGNITVSIDFGDPGPADDLSTTITYHAVPARYIMNMPKTVTVTGGGQVYRQKASTINNTTGKVTELRQLLQSGDIAKYNMTYDATGNLLSLSRPQNATGQRLLYTYQYDGDVQTYVTKVTDSYGYSSSTTYDVRFGQMLSTTNLNGQQTQYTIDNAGRVSTIKEPLEIASGKPFTIAYEYHPEAIVPWALAKHFDPANPANFLETASFKDGLGREVQTKKDIALFAGAKAADQEVMVVSGSTTFDAFDRPVVQYYPMTEPKGSTLGTYNAGSDDVDPFLRKYDVLDRLLVDTLPDRVRRTMAYGFGNDRNGVVQFKTTSTDANGISTEKFLNVRELLKATKQQYSQGSDVWTSYDYNPVNELIKVTDDQNNVITMAYDQLGRKTSETHPDAGTTNYKHDLAGNITEKTTANLQSGGTGIRYTYDQERLLKVSYPKNPQNNVTLTYGAPGESSFRAGRVSKQQDGSGTQQFFYNPLGDIVKNIRVINVPDTLPLTYTTEWTYDTWNRLTAMVYPDGEKLTYNYNVGGSLLNMTGVNNGTTFNYLTQMGYDKFEKRVFTQYGNGTEMTYTFGAQRRELANMSAKTSASRFMMDNTYTWDNEDEILGVVNAAPVPPSNLMGGKSDYQYTYDDMYRLTGASGSFTGSSSENRFTLDMTYNTVSGILGKEQVHTKKGKDDIDWVPRNQTTYSYDYNYNPGSKPHAPVKIGTESFTYDANGNQTGWQDDVSAQNRQMEWDEENRIKTLSDNGYLTQYTYDAAGTRVLKSVGNGQTVSINGKKVATSSGTGNYTIYVNPYQVVQSSGYTKHIFIEGQRIVSKLGVSSKSGSNRDAFQFYYHPDHLGNSAFITDAKGEVYQHLEYFPFGETFVAEESNQQRTPYLYNGKEQDDETGMYYYGARYYDAITSIWQGVDPSWDLPNQIGTSPYAYVQNNPITYIDPDGQYRYFSQGGIFGNDLLRLTAPGLPKMLGWIPENRNKENLRFVLQGQRANPNALQNGMGAGSLVSRNQTAEDDMVGTPSNAKQGAKTGRKFYATLTVAGIDLLSNTPPEKSARQKQKQEQKALFTSIQKAFVGELRNKLNPAKGKPSQKSVFLSILKSESQKRRQ